MITINGKKMGKSYNNVIKLTELFSGNHPLLTQAFHPMTIRFFILQSHYRSTLDFSSESLTASEKALKRLWLHEFELFVDDDFSTPKVLANMFEMAPIINSLKDGLIAMDAISPATLQQMKDKFKIYLEDIFGLQSISGQENEALNGIMQLLIDIRKEAKTKKDFATSDKIRNQLNALGILLKDEKGGEMSWSIE
jgi:cysteinyl-tRNA synthetase